jgi:hypothetical protein
MKTTYLMCGVHHWPMVFPALGLGPPYCMTCHAEDALARPKYVNPNPYRPKDQDPEPDRTVQEPMPLGSDIFSLEKEPDCGRTPFD